MVISNLILKGLVLTKSKVNNTERKETCGSSTEHLKFKKKEKRNAFLLQV